MKKVLKRISAILLTAAMTVSMAACGGSPGNNDAQGSGNGAAGNTQGAAGGSAAVQGKECTIGVAFYQDTSLQRDATIAYLEALSDTLNVKYVYTTLSSQDESANMTKVQELIAAGADGIITTMDLKSAIIEECAAAGVYVGGYLCDFDTSYVNEYDKVFKNEYFVGSASDGQTPDDVTMGTTMFESLMDYNERNADAPITHVSMTVFPSWAYPIQAVGAEQFVAAVEEYNKTAETPITVDPLNTETDELPFTPLDSTYFAKHEGIQAIISFAAGNAFVYPTMVNAGVDSEIKLFTTGFDGGEENNFGSNGTGTYQQMMATAPESVIYPLVLILNKINGASYADQPEDAERVSSATYVINSDEDLAKVQKSCYYTKDAANALYTPEEVLNMTAYANPDATYADLKAVLSNITVENIR